MQLPIEVFGNVAVIHTPEEMGTEFSEQFPTFVEDLDQRSIVIDMDGTETVQSQGLETLLQVQERLHGELGELKLCSENSTNRKILEITRLDQEIDVFDCVLDAVKSFNQ